MITPKVRISRLGHCIQNIPYVPHPNITLTVKQGKGKTPGKLARKTETRWRGKPCIKPVSANFPHVRDKIAQNVVVGSLMKDAARRIGGTAV